MKPPLSPRQARIESERCLYCDDAPCTAACPAHIDIPGFIAMIRSGNVLGAAEVVRSANAMAHVCGRVCPEEVYCRRACTRGRQDVPIAIRELHFFATQQQAERRRQIPSVSPGQSHSVAVVGGGPAGLACAFTSARLGYRVELYDRGLPGGVPAQSIPLFRLSREEVDVDVALITRFIRVHQREIDREEFLAIERANDALFLASGLPFDRGLPIPGADLPGVFPVLEFLRSARAEVKLLEPGRRVVVVGGGNVSLDAAATAKRMGSEEVSLIYRRGPREMRVWNAELEEARHMGIEIHYFVAPVEILGPERVRGVRCRRTRLSSRCDDSGRPIPVELEGTEYLLEADTVIPAIGQVPGDGFLDLFERGSRGYLKVDGSFATSRPKVFAGGDLIGGEGTVVQSVGHGTEAARAIHRFLSGDKG